MSSESSACSCSSDCHKLAGEPKPGIQHKLLHNASHVVTNVLLMVTCMQPVRMTDTSLVPRPDEDEEKGPGNEAKLMHVYM